MTIRYKWVKKGGQLSEIDIERDGLHRYSWMKDMDPVLFFGKIFIRGFNMNKDTDNQSEVFIASIRGKKQFIKKDQIWFAESIGRKVSLYLEDENVEVYSRMADLMDDLGSGFFRAHRSYIVNLDHVEGYEKNEIILSDKTRVPMSRHKYREFLNAYLTR